MTTENTPNKISEKNDEIDLLELWQSIKAGVLEAIVNFYKFLFRYKIMLAVLVLLGTSWGIYNVVSAEKQYYGSMVAYSDVTDKLTLRNYFLPIEELISFGDTESLSEVLNLSTDTAELISKFEIDTVENSNRVTIKVGTRSKIDYKNIKQKISTYISSQAYLTELYDSYISSLNSQLAAIDIELEKLDSLQTLAIIKQNQRIDTKDLVIVNEDQKKSYTAEILDLKNKKDEIERNLKYNKIFRPVSDFTIIEDAPNNSWVRVGIIRGAIFFVLGIIIGGIIDFVKLIHRTAQEK